MTNILFEILHHSTAMALSDAPILRLVNKQSGEEKTAEANQTALASTITNNMNQTFGQSQNIQGGLNAQLQQIVNRAQAGQGYLPGEEANLESNNKENEAQQDITAEQALNARNAGRGEGQAGTSGSVGATDTELANDAAASAANTNRNITANNYTLARGNLATGLTGLGNLGGQLANESVGQGSQAVSGDSNSYNDANKPSNFWSNLGGSLLGGAANSLTGSNGLGWDPL